MNSWAMAFHYVIAAAFLETCERTNYEDFVYIGRLHASPPQPPSTVVHFCFDISCHVTHFVTSLEDLLTSTFETDETTPPENVFAKWPECEVEFNWHDFQAYRITRIGPKLVSIQFADQIRTIETPFATSSMLTLLAQIKNSPLLILDDALKNEEEVQLFRYLAAVNDGEGFSFDDFIVDKSNAEVFRFANSKYN